MGEADQCLALLLPPLLSLVPVKPAPGYKEWGQQSKKLIGTGGKGTEGLRPNRFPRCSPRGVSAPEAT